MSRIIEPSHRVEDGVEICPGPPRPALAGMGSLPVRGYAVVDGPWS